MTLSILWFILIAVLWIGYLTLEGFDFGVGMILKILGRDERERRATLSTIGPHWDGNEVWLLTAGGATFAAFPEWYSTLFSGAYIVLFIILLCLIVRVCAIEWRPKVNSQTWRDRWDWVHTISAWLPSILWGVAFANLVQGMHIEVVQTSNGAVVPASQVPADSLVPGAAHQITGGLLTMVTPFTLLGGAVTCLLFLNHGALFVALKTTGDLSQRALRMSRRLAPPATAGPTPRALGGGRGGGGHRPRRPGSRRGPRPEGRRFSVSRERGRMWPRIALRSAHGSDIAGGAPARGTHDQN